MIDWITKIGKNYPEFWQKYISKFDKKTTRFVAISLETSGLNANENVILGLSGFGIYNNAIILSDSIEIEIFQPKYFRTIDNKEEYLVSDFSSKKPEPQAIQLFIEYIENAVLVGHHIHYDVDIINKALENLGCGRLKNEALDVEIMHRKLHDINDKEFQLNALCKIYNVPDNQRISASEESYKIGLLFLKLKARLGIE